jgi:hypothetical protein
MNHPMRPKRPKAPDSAETGRPAAEPSRGSMTPGHSDTLRTSTEH